MSAYDHKLKSTSSSNCSQNKFEKNFIDIGLLEMPFNWCVVQGKCPKDVIIGHPSELGVILRENLRNTNAYLRSRG